MELASVRAGTGKLSIEVEREDYLKRVDATPTNAVTSGMYVVGLHRALRRAGVDQANPEQYHPLKYYPLRDFMELMLDAAATLHPNVRLGEGLRRLGLMVIPNFAESFGGKVIMSLGACSWEMALSCVTRGYELSLKPGRARVVQHTKGHAEVELREIWSFGESYQVGVLQGLMDWYHIHGVIKPEVLSASHTMLHMEWASQ